MIDDWWGAANSSFRAEHTFRAEASDADILLSTLASFEYVENSSYNPETRILSYRIEAPKGETRACYLAVTHALETALSLHCPVKAPLRLRKTDAKP